MLFYFTTPLNLSTAVHNVNQHYILEQAITAAQYEDWTCLNQCLQELLTGDENQALPLNQATPSSREALLQEVLPFALLILDGGEFQDQWEVAKLFPMLGDIAIAPLLARLHDQDADPDVRWFAARIVSEFRQPQVLAALIDGLRCATSAELCDGVATALAGFGVVAIASLADLVMQDSTRLLAVRTLSQIRHSAAIPVLLSVVADPHPPVRELAIEALSSFHNPQIPPILVAALQDTVATVRQVAVVGLGFRADLLDHLDLVEAIRPLLDDRHLEVGQQAAIALGRLGTPAAIAALTQSLQSAHTPDLLRVDLVRSLVWTNQEQALASLHHLLQSSQVLYAPAVLQALIIALAQVELPLKEQATAVLVTLLESNPPALHQPSLRQGLAFALGQLGQAIALSPLQQLLTDPDSGVQLHAIAALKQLGFFCEDMIKK